MKSTHNCSSCISMNYTKYINYIFYLHSFALHKFCFLLHLVDYITSQYLPPHSLLTRRKFNYFTLKREIILTHRKKSISVHNHTKKWNLRFIILTCSFLASSSKSCTTPIPKIFTPLNLSTKNNFRYFKMERQWSSQKETNTNVQWHIESQIW